jgi:hypothetical protein
VALHAVIMEAYGATPVAHLSRELCG